MLTLQTISDRLELQDLTYAYAYAIDTQDFQALEQNILAPDVQVDYTKAGGPAGDIHTFFAWCKPGLAAFDATHHLMANHHFKIDGDRATGRIMCYNPLQWPANESGVVHVMVHGLYYIDEYVRLANGWRISSRRAEGSYIFNALSDPEVRP